MRRAASGSLSKTAWVPSPWWTSQSTIAILSSCPSRTQGRRPRPPRCSAGRTRRHVAPPRDGRVAERPQTRRAPRRGPRPRGPPARPRPPPAARRASSPVEVRVGSRSSRRPRRRARLRPRKVRRVVDGTIASAVAICGTHGRPARRRPPRRPSRRLGRPPRAARGRSGCPGAAWPLHCRVGDQQHARTGCGSCGMAVGAAPAHGG